MEQTIRILWLSDIHYTGTYEEKNLLEKRNKKFLETVESYLGQIKMAHPTDNKLHYVILSGDIGFSGEKNEYNQFDADIMAPLKTIFDNNGQSPLILACPGNHDVNRNKSSLHKEYVKAVDDYVNMPKRQRGGAKEAQLQSAADRENSIRQVEGCKTENKVHDIFKEYSEYVEKIFNYYTHSTEEYETDNYQENKFLQGYIIDNKQKLIINILNSAAFSLGDKFDDLIVEHFLDKFKTGKRIINHQSFKEFAEEILKVKEFCTEYGRQVIGNYRIENQGYLKELNRYQHYLVLTFFHHPLSWLQESQKNDYSDKFKKTALIQLLQGSDILLTGHEHVGINSTPEFLFDRVLHIPGGMFIQDKNRFYKGGQNRFHVLELDTKNRRLDIRNFVWEGNMKKWYDYKESEVPGYEEKWENKSLQKRPTTFLCDQNKKDYVDDFKNSFSVSKFLDTFLPGETLGKGDLTVPPDYVIERELFCKFESLKNDNEDVLAVQVYGVVTFLFDDNKGLEHIKNIYNIVINFARDSTKTKQVIFIFLDILADPTFEKDYLSDINEDGSYNLKTDSANRAHYGKIVKTIDARFNLFRNRFFYQFELFCLDNSNKTLFNIENQLFESISELNISNFVIPFWEVINYKNKKNSIKPQ